MSFIEFMETMGTSSIPIVAAFFIGLMMAISPCPLATNITAVAYTSKKIGNSKHTMLVGFLYTLGRMFTYVCLASLIVYVGINVQAVSLFLQEYGEKILGPLLLIVGVAMLGVLRLHFFKSDGRLNNLKEKLASKGFLGSFLLGVIFALAFCPFSAVLFFGMLIPLALGTGDGLIIPAVFAFATGLPVIIFSMILVKGVSKLGSIMNKVQTFELWMRRIVGIIFIIMGLYYISLMVI
ncbi:MAG: sulfite exporter TauE/SafE family protein [Nanoarchaeota archaeon]|nr:sulfite exporter TauE/SafE family protein [Nanoarchaeota archaeon]MBU1052071.1 sulfite exporter TauE/SafE family protein [Nanoarchaeota archaeon]